MIALEPNLREQHLTLQIVILQSIRLALVPKHSLHLLLHPGFARGSHPGSLAPHSILQEHLE